MNQLTGKQRRFIEELAKNSFNATQAATAAGYRRAIQDQTNGRQGNVIGRCHPKRDRIAVRIRSVRSGHALTSSAKSGYTDSTSSLQACTKLSKPVDKTEFAFSVSALFSGVS